MIIAPYSSRGVARESALGLAALAHALAPGDPVSVAVPVTPDPVDGVVAGLPALRAAVAAEPGVPVALIGECTLVPAILAAMLEREPETCLIWVDAHGDLNTPETSPSGFIGGMPLAVLTGACHPRWREAAGLTQGFPDERVALVGARDLDPGERELLDRTTMHEVDTCAEAIAALPAGAPLYVHLDTDVLDPSEVPDAGFPAPGGWSVERFVSELEALARSGRVVAVSVCPSAPPSVDARIVRALLAHAD